MYKVPTQKANFVIAVDIGGSKIKGGIFSESGLLLDLIRLDTPDNTPEIIEQIYQVINHLCEKNSRLPSAALGIGISIAAFIKSNGFITNTAHLPKDIIGLNLGVELNKRLSGNYYFALDTPAPTLGEFYYGAGKNMMDMVYVTISTGIGAGIISDGKYFTGGLGWAGGIGHCIINEDSKRLCMGCGKYGCLETFAAKQGIIAFAHEFVEKYPNSLIMELVKGDKEKIEPHIVYEAAMANDDAAIKVFSSAGYYLGIGLSYIVNIISPSIIVVGGGISRAGDLILEPARDVVENFVFPSELKKVRIVQAKLDDLSSVYGAAAMVINDIRIN